MDITLRPARPEDAEEMARWFVDLTDLAQWGGPDVRFPLTQEQMAGWIAEIAHEMPRLCFTAVDADDTPMGHVQFLHDPPKKWARLGRFAVARHRRGEGFGRTLFDHAVRFAFTELAVDHLTLAVVPENRIAHSMYKRSGFVDEGRFPGSWTVAGKPFVMNVMGLSRADWIRLAGVRGDAAKVA